MSSVRPLPFSSCFPYCSEGAGSAACCCRPAAIIVEHAALLFCVSSLLRLRILFLPFISYFTRLGEDPSKTSQLKETMSCSNFILNYF